MARFLFKKEREILSLIDIVIVSDEDYPNIETVLKVQEDLKSTARKLRELNKKFDFDINDVFAVSSFEYSLLKTILSTP